MTRNAIAWMQLNEDIRSHQATETESKRHNLATESESNRHNVASEQIDLGHLNESIRHNQVTEAETSRHNQASEQLDLGRLNETIRHNQASEGLQAESNRIQSAYNDAMVSARNFENALRQVEVNNRNSNELKRIELEGVDLINKLNQSKFHNVTEVVNATGNLSRLLSQLKSLGGNKNEQQK